MNRVADYDPAHLEPTGLKAAYLLSIGIMRQHICRCVITVMHHG